MKRPMTKRRLIYLGTALTVFAMLGGFALASVTLGGTTISSSQGTTGTTLSATAWAASSVDSGFAGVTGTCGTAVTITTAVAVSGYVAGTSSACATGDISETIAYAATVPAGTSGVNLVDTFTVYSNAGSAVTHPITVTVTESGTSYTANLDLVVDYGTTGSVTITSLGVGINGQL